MHVGKRVSYRIGSTAREGVLEGLWISHEDEEMADVRLDGGNRVSIAVETNDVRALDKETDAT